MRFKGESWSSAACTLTMHKRTKKSSAKFQASIRNASEQLQANSTLMLILERKEGWLRKQQCPTTLPKPWMDCEFKLEPA
jgi:hypothetical protein